MSIFYNIIIAPIELIVEIFFEIIFRIVGQREINQGITLIGVSLAISLTTLPLYRKADKIQRSAREKQKNMQGWINHIRKTFKDYHPGRGRAEACRVRRGLDERHPHL